jgi:hypothetical protein
MRYVGDGETAGVGAGEGKFEGTFEADGDGVVSGRIRLHAKNLAASAEQDSGIGCVGDSDRNFDCGAFGDRGVARQENAAEADVLGSSAHFLPCHFDQHGQVQWVTGFSSFLTRFLTRLLTGRLTMGIELGEGHRVSPASFLMAENTLMTASVGRSPRCCVWAANGPSFTGLRR